jgi:hypothetical protein
MAHKQMREQLNDVAINRVRRNIGEPCRSRNQFYGLQAVSCAFSFIDVVKELRGIYYSNLPPQSLYKLFGELTTKGCKRPDDFVNLRNSIEHNRRFLQSPYCCIPISRDYWDEGLDKIAPYRNLTLFEAELCQARARHPQIGFYVTTRPQDFIVGVYYEKKEAALSQNVKVHDWRSIKNDWTIGRLRELTRQRIGEQSQPQQQPQRSAPSQSEREDAPAGETVNA